MGPQRVANLGMPLAAKRSAAGDIRWFPVTEQGSNGEDDSASAKPPFRWSGGRRNVNMNALVVLRAVVEIALKPNRQRMPEMAIDGNYNGKANWKSKL